MLNGGKTMLVTVGKKGKHVGLVGLYPHDSPRERFLLVTLTKQFSNSAGPMKALIQDEYRDMLKATGIVANFLRRGTLERRHVRRRRNLQEVPPQHISVLVRDRTRPRVRNAQARPQAQHDL